MASAAATSTTTITPKTVFRIVMGLDKYALLLHLESIVRSRLNKLLVGDKSHLGWEYGSSATSILVFTASKRYTKDTEAALAHIVFRYVGVR